MSGSEKSRGAFENETEDDLPQHILEKYDTEQQVQLIKGYRLLQVLLYYESNKPFFDKPDNDVLGTKRYYDVIENPMWLLKIKRKFFHAEYNSLYEVIKDIRLIFENCYYFWGPRALLTEQCLRMEKQFEQQLSLLPKDLKSMCTLEKTHGPCDKITNRVWNQCKNRGRIGSVLMLRTWKRRRQLESDTFALKADIANFCEYSEQLLKWEANILLLPDNYKPLFSMQELPEIGIFLQLIRNQFEVGTFCQCEIERMLLMPQYSSLFRRVLSILLSVTGDERSLSYDDIHEKLEERIAEWYTAFKTVDDDAESLKDFQSLGIDSDFFESVGQTNPFVEARKFETLSYYQKVIILRALCDNWVRQRPAVNELIMATEADSFVQKLGQDKHGYTYVYCNRFLDFRMYKLQLENNQVRKSEMDESEAGDENGRLPLKHLFAGEAVVKDCELKADSLEQLRCLIDDFYYSDLESGSVKREGKGPQSSLVQALLKLDADLYSREEEFIRVSNECRIQLYSEWRDHSGCDEPLVSDDASEAETEAPESEQPSRMNDEDAEFARTNDGEDNHEDEKRSVASGECDVDESSYQIETSQDKLEDECSSSTFETCEERRSRKRKKKKKKKKKKRRSRDHDEESDSSKLNESFTEELHDVVKDEPLDENESQQNAESTNSNAEEDVMLEIKEELPDEVESNGLVGNRRRRSSVPSYNVYNNDAFSDAGDSAEEMFSSEEDSDDEWEIPCKRAKTKRTRSTRQNRSENSESKTEGSNCTSRRRDVSPSEPSMDDTSADDTTKPASPVKTDLSHVSEMIIKEEDIKTEASDEPPIKSEEVVVKEEDKPTQKIKVIDFAKLVNNSASAPALKPTAAPSPSNHNPNPYAIRPVPGLHSLPVITSAYSQNQLPPNMYMRQPMMRNAYMMASPNQPPPAYGYMNANHAAGYAAGRTMSPNATPRIVGAQSINPACPNQKAAFRQAPPYPQPPMMMRFSVKQSQPQPQLQQQLQLPPQSLPPMNKNKMMPGARYPTTASYAPSVYSNNYTPLQKIGRNVTVEAKPTQRNPGIREIEGTIGIHSNSGGFMQYVVNLANGSHVPLTNEQVQKLREGNNGVLPTKLKIPVPVDVAEKIEPFVVVIDD